MRLRKFWICVNLAALLPSGAAAHVSEQGLVLLLPTGAYITAGVATVALTVLAVFALPANVVHALFAHKPIRDRKFGIGPDVSSLISLGVLMFGIYLGFYGPRDPLSNLLPLGFWTVGWIALVSLSAVFGNIWTWLNPWTGLYRLVGPGRPLLALPAGLGLWPATLVLIGFAAFLLADIAPNDPARLARVVAVYWLANFAGLLVFGPGWLTSAELGRAIIATYARLAPVRVQPPAGVGVPGWQFLGQPPVAAAGVFALTLLAVGSFDGMNETFWWLARIGVNPLEFPGRSAVVGATLLGLAGAIAGLIAVFAVTIWLGRVLSRAEVDFRVAFGWLSLSVLPIALAYHIAHYLTAFLVDIQYTIAALTDPFARGDDWLRLQPFHVTTGFFNSIDTVRIIWTTQAGVVVLGHVWSVLLSHRIALSLFGNGPRAALATLPVSLFMIGYTFLGLWLLAAPKGA